jgi:ELWxxDGT repeat protein
MTVMGNRVYFFANDGVTGNELWSTDGTPAGTSMVRDINQGAASSVGSRDTFRGFAVMNGFLYFTATSVTTNNFELWRSDGTLNGTQQVMDIAPGVNDSSDPQYLTVVGNRLYFSAFTGNFGRELWQSDGTMNGTTQVADINLNAASSNPKYLVQLNQKLIFNATKTDNANNVGSELWSLDTTNGVTSLLADIQPGPGSSDPQKLFANGPNVFFTADDGNLGRELYATDGTPAGTRLVANINALNASSDPDFFVARAGSNTVFFAATSTNDYGRELWRSNGQTGGLPQNPTTNMVQDIYPGPGDSSPHYLAADVVGRTFYFGADGNDGTGRELWKSNGTFRGTSRVADINAGPLGSTPYNFTFAGSTMYFSAIGTDQTGQQIGRELYRYDMPRPTVVGRVWNDANGDGFQDPTETGMSHVSVELHLTDGTLIASTQTDSQGNYTFASLDPGNYYLAFVNPQGYTFSPQNPNFDEFLDSDADSNGRTQTFNLVMGDDAPFDAGLIPSIPLVANADSNQTVVNLPVTTNVLANDSGPTGFYVLSVTRGTNGTVVLNSDLRTVTYTPNTNYQGQDVFTYTVTDGYSTATANVTITVGQPQLAAGGIKTDGGPVPLLTQADLQPIIAQAMRDVSQDFGGAANSQLLGELDFRIADLQAGILGITYRNTIWIDQSAAGYGWFLDRSPQTDGLYGTAIIGQDRLAARGSAAFGKMDLLTVVEHELGHVVGFASVDASVLPHDLMTATLDAGIRRTAARLLSGSSVPTSSVAPTADLGQWFSNEQVFASTQAPGLRSAPVSDAMAAGWLLENYSSAGVNDALGSASVLAPRTGDELPARVSWWDLPMPSAAFESSPDLPPLAMPATKDDVLLQVRHGARADTVLVGGDGDDMLIGAEGRDVLVGGVGSTRATPVDDAAV